MNADPLHASGIDASAPGGHSVAKMIIGEVASSGLARGRALLCDCARQNVVPRRHIGESESEAEMTRFAEAVELTGTRRLLKLKPNTTCKTVVAKGGSLLATTAERSFCCLVG